MLTSIEVQKVINKYNSTKSKIFKNNKHSQYECKLSYSTMQAARLLQHNNPLNTIIIIANIKCLQVLKIKNKINKYNSIISIQISKFNEHSKYQLKQPYNTMQAIRLLQHNNPPNTIINITL